MTPANIKYAAALRGSIQTAIEKQSFNYAEFFPESLAARASAPATKPRYTVQALVDTYIDTAKKSKSLSPSTLASYTRWANSRICPKWGNEIAEDIQTPDMRQWIAELSEELGQKSVRNCVGLLGAVLKRAESESAIARNPLGPISLQSVLPKRKKTDDENHVDPFNDEEIASILGAMRTKEEKAFWQFAFASGLRTGELIALKWANIDSVRGAVWVEDNIVSAGKGEGTVEKDTKTGNGREVPLLPAAVEAINAMRPISKLVGPYVFLHPVTQTRWRDDQQLRKGSWTAALLRAEVRYRNPYQTRHTFASRLLMSGEPELLVANLLGHASTEMVRRHYGRYIKQTGGVILRGDYSGFGANLGQKISNGADLGQVNPACATLKPTKQKTRIGRNA